MNSFEFFDEMLAHLVSTLGAATPGFQSRDSFCLALARSAFLRFSTERRWIENAPVIVQRLGGALAPAEMEWYEECADATAYCCCYVLGALLGKQSAGEISKQELMVADAHLAAYLLNDTERICRLIHEKLASAPPQMRR